MGTWKPALSLTAISILILTATGPAQAREFRKYSCFPREMRASCGHRPDPPAIRATFEIFKSCSKMVKDRGTLAKYGTLLVMMVGGGPLLSAAAYKYAGDEALPDAFKCVLKGLSNTYGGTPADLADRAKTIDQLFLVRDWKGSAKNLHKLWIKDPEALHKGLAAFEAYQRMGEAPDMAALAASTWDPKTYTDKANSLMQGVEYLKDTFAFPDLKAQELFEQAIKLSRNCELAQAQAALAKAKAQLELYCKSEGQQYRQLQWTYDCYPFWYGNLLMPGSNSAQLHRHQQMREELGRSKRLILRRLKLGEEIKQHEKVVGNLTRYFKHLIQQYEAKSSMLDKQLTRGDLPTSCQAFLQVKAVRDKASGGQLDCPDKVGPEFKTQQARVWKLLIKKEGEVKQDIEGIQLALKNDKLEQGWGLLSKAKPKADKLVVPIANKCQPGLAATALKQDLANLEDRLKQALKARYRCERPLGSEPVWDDKLGRPKCVCPDNTIVNLDKSKCLAKGHCGGLMDKYRKHLAAGDQSRAEAALKLFRLHKCPESDQWKEVPHVTGHRVEEAKSILKKDAFSAVVQEVQPAPSKRYAHQVKSQDPLGGTVRKVGSPVRLKVYGAYSVQAAMDAHDCSQFPGMVVKWDKDKQRPYCSCPDDQKWSRKSQACRDLQQVLVEEKDCSGLPGTVARWNAKENRADCYCPGDTFWGPRSKACVPPRQAALESADCSKFPGSVPRWDEKTGRIMCVCPDNLIPLHSLGRCESCGGVEKLFAQAVNSGQVSQAQHWLSLGTRCPWHGKAQAFLQNKISPPAQAQPVPQPQPGPAPAPALNECQQIDQMILRACQSGSYDSVRHLEDRWFALGCTMSAATTQCIENEADQGLQPFRRSMGLQ